MSFIGRPTLFLLLALALLGLSACQEAPVRAAALKPVEKRKPAPDFTLKDADGRTVRLSSYKGKVVLLNFWATWCGPCKIEIPWFVEFQQKYQDKGFAVLGVSMDDEGWDVVKPYIAQHKVNYRILLGNDLVAEQYGGVDSLPTTFLLDQQLRIASIHVGLVSKDVYEREIRELLGAVQGSGNDSAAGGRNPRAD